MGLVKVVSIVRWSSDVESVQSNTTQEFLGLGDSGLNMEVAFPFGPTLIKICTNLEKHVSCGIMG